jgi:hypothetical protein
MRKQDCTILVVATTFLPDKQWCTRTAVDQQNIQNLGSSPAPTPKTPATCKLSLMDKLWSNALKLTSWSCCVVQHRVAALTYHSTGSVVSRAKRAARSRILGATPGAMEHGLAGFHTTHHLARCCVQRNTQSLWQRAHSQPHVAPWFKPGSNQQQQLGSWPEEPICVLPMPTTQPSQQTQKSEPEKPSLA